MSNPNSSSDVLDNVIVQKVKSIRPPSLAGKYNKFLLFGFQFIEQLKTHNLLSDIDASYQLLSLFSTVEEQTEYFDNFFLNIKSSTKEMKIVLKNKLNANKPIKAKKEKGKSTIPNPDTNQIVSNDAVLTDAIASEKKRGRKKKDNTVVHDKQDQIVIDLLAAANNPDLIIPSSIIATSTETTEPTTVATQPATAPKYIRKPKKDAAIAATKEHILTINNATTPTIDATTIAVTEDKPKPKRKPAVKKNSDTSTTPIIQPVTTTPIIQPNPVLPIVETSLPVLPIVEPALPATKPTTYKKTKAETDKKTKAETDKKTKAEKKNKIATKSDHPLAELVTEPPITSAQLIIPTAEEEEEEEEEEITTETFTHEGIHYLKDENHIVYNKDTFDVIGKYNKNTNTINPIDT